MSMTPRHLWPLLVAASLVACDSPGFAPAGTSVGTLESRVGEHRPSLLFLPGWVQREDATSPGRLPPEDWSFVPDTANGCVRFTPDSEPGAGDSVDFRYTSTVQR